MSAWEHILATMASEQRAAATAVGNTVVSAGAGSGKTRVLAVRYLHLVKDRGLHPGRIACLTFTNKASAEMRERIRGLLEDCATDDTVFAEALAAFPQSCVTTLDSLCSEIARNASARWGLPPDFGIDQQAAKDETRSVALDFLLRRRTEAVIARFIAANGFEGSVEALCSLATGRDGLIGPAEEAFDFNEQTRKLRLSLEALYIDIASTMEAGRGLECGAAKVAKAWSDAAEAWPERTPDYDSPADIRAVGEACQRLMGLRKPTGSQPAALYFNAACDGVKQRALGASQACQALSDPDRKAALAFARDFILEARQRRIASGILQFQDVAAMAREALLLDRALRTWYKSRFDAVMVDEFQDDNELQKEILYLLAERRGQEALADGILPGPGDLEPGVLFFVGDEKQSIYLFRNADVKVFRGLADELLSSQPTPASTRAADDPSGTYGSNNPACFNLSTNWRSEPALIDFFNQTFSRVMPAPGDPGARDYEARFAGLLAGPATPGVPSRVSWMEATEPERGSGQDPASEPADAGGAERVSGAEGNTGRNTTDKPEKPAGLSALEAQAWRVAELIRELVDTGVAVTAKGASGKEARACQYEDIAILFRASAAQNIYERYLRIFGIPYTATASAGIYVESVLGDLYAILRLAAFPEDRLALASVLRGPFARLSDDACFAVLEQARETGWSLADPGLPESLGDLDAVKLGTLAATWTWVRNMADRLSLAELVSVLWYERGLRWNVLRKPDNTAYLEHFDFAWSLAADADARGQRLCDFISILEPMIGEVKKVEDIPVVRESARGVSVMTVHASKGLEFPVVFLPGTENTGRGDRQEAIAFNERLGPSVRLMDDTGRNVDPVYQMGKTMDAMERTVDDTVMDEDLAETVRLFYVACTRAVSRLYLCSKVPRNEDKKAKSFRGLFLRAWPEAAGSGEKAEVADNTPAEGPPSGASQPTPETELPGWLSIDPIPGRSVADYARLVNAGSAKTGDAAAAAARIARAEAPALPSRKARWAVTQAAETLAASAAAAAAAAAAGPEPEPSEPPRSRPEKTGGRTAAELYGENSFGTLCHELTERLLRFPELAAEPSPASTRLLNRLSATAREAVLQEATSLAQSFVDSPRGQAAAEARAALAAGDNQAVFNLEYGFTWRGEAQGRPVFLNGSMDLVYGDARGVCVVDFKTDRVIRPEQHAFQLAVYRESAASIFGVPATAVLHYLRSGEEREIDTVPDLSFLPDQVPQLQGSGIFSAGQASNV